MRQRSVNKKQSSGPTFQYISRWTVLFKRIGDFCETIGASVDVRIDRKLLHSELVNLPLLVGYSAPPYSPTIPIHIYLAKENESSAVSCGSSFQHGRDLELGSLPVYILGIPYALVLFGPFIRSLWWHCR